METEETYIGIFIFKGGGVFNFDLGMKIGIIMDIIHLIFTGGSLKT